MSAETSTLPCVMIYFEKNFFRNISLMLKATFNTKVSHTTVSNWCVKVAPPIFDYIMVQLVSLLVFNIGFFCISIYYS